MSASDDVAAIAARLTEAQRYAVASAHDEESRGVWHPAGWFVYADRRVRYNLCRAKLTDDYLRPRNRLTPLGEQVRAHLASASQEKPL